MITLMLGMNDGGYSVPESAEIDAVFQKGYHCILIDSLE